MQCDDIDAFVLLRKRFAALHKLAGDAQPAHATDLADSAETVIHATFNIMHAGLQHKMNLDRSLQAGVSTARHNGARQHSIAESLCR